MTSAQQTPQEPDQPSAGVKSKVSRGDKSFVEDAANAITEELALSQIAVTTATNPQVREFAQQMITDHAAVQAELTSLASLKGVTIDQKKLNLDKWQTKSAKEFDSDYIKKMVDDHEKAVKLFEKQSTKGEDAELISFASKTLPSLQMHLQHARELHQTLKSSS